MPSDDSELVARARAGDRAAFNRLVDRHLPSVRRVTRRMIADADLARELAHETMLQAYLSLPQLRNGCRFESWLQGIALNVCRSHLRERKTAPLPLEVLETGLIASAASLSPPDPQQLVEERERRRQVMAAIHSLSAKDRAAILLFHYQQLSLQDIAPLLETTVGALKVRLHKARRRLRERLAPLYPERAAAPEKGRRKMIPVTIADVLQLEGTGHCIAVLLDEKGGRALPVWIGNSEAVQIAIGVAAFPTARPMTFQFVGSMLHALGAGLEEVRVDALRENTYYAVVKLRGPEGVRELDARPSDALALAQRLGSPIYVVDEVMESAGVPLAEGPGDLGARLGQEGLISLVRAYRVVEG